MTGTRLRWLCGALLLGMTFAAYYPVWENELVDFDDQVFITYNPHVADGLTAENIRWAVVNTEPPYRMPLTYLSLQLDVEIAAAITGHGGESHLRPEVFHAHNLLWHGGNVLLLFGLCFRLGAPLGRAFVVAAVFAVHPMHVESVAWAIERKDVLMCFFGLLSVHAYLRYVTTHGWAAYAVMFGALVLSLMSKPMLMTMPFVLFLLDYWPLGRLVVSAPQPGQVTRRVRPGQLVIEKLPLFAVVVLVGLDTFDTRPGVPMGVITFPDRCMNALAGYGWYVTTTFYPTPLAVVYPHPHAEWSWGQSLTGAAILAAVTAVTVRQAARRPWLAVGWLWFIGTLFPVIGFAQGGQQAWADRFSYWPHIGLFIALGWGYAEVAKRLRVPALISAMLWTGVLVGLGVLTTIQVGYWRTSTVLWEHTVAVTVRNDFAHERLSVAYRRDGRITEAEAQMDIASELIQRRFFPHRHPRPAPQ